MKNPVKKTLPVPLTTTEAFSLFTTDIDTWWPKTTHSVKGDKTRVTFDAHKGGQIVEVDEDGKTHIWGTIIVYDAGKYIAFSWHPGRPESEATTVAVSFTSTEGGTLCELTHGGFDIMGPTADAVSTSYLRGWNLVLGCFQSAAKTPVAA